MSWTLKTRDGDVALDGPPEIDGRSLRVRTQQEFAYPIPGFSCRRIGFDLPLWDRFVTLGFGIRDPDGNEWDPIAAQRTT